MLSGKRQSDDFLVSRALAGNSEAWLALVKRHDKAVYNYGLRMMGNSEDAADLMQDVFAAVCRGLASFRGEASFRTWLFRIASNRAIELHRKKKSMIDIAHLPERACDDSAPHSDLSQAQTQQQVARALEVLPIHQKVVVELKFFQQFTFDEIADQLDVSTSAVKTRLYTALDKLKVVLERDHVEI